MSVHECGITELSYAWRSVTTGKNGFWYLVLNSRGQLIKLFRCKNAMSEFLK